MRSTDTGIAVVKPGCNHCWCLAHGMQSIARTVLAKFVDTLYPAASRHQRVHAVMRTAFGVALHTAATTHTV
eukprot:2780-Heterococcus_DN1.PRE.2